MQLFIFACLVAIGRSAHFDYNERAKQAPTLAHFDHATTTTVPAHSFGATTTTVPAHSFGLGRMLRKVASLAVQGGRAMHEASVKTVETNEKAKVLAKIREDSSVGRLRVLQVNLPQVKALCLKMCSRPDGYALCSDRGKMFNSISNMITNGDPKVVEMLRKSAQLLQDFMHMDGKLRGALSSLTIYELAGRPPAGMPMIADINPRDGKVDRYEWSEYLKAIYPFTILDDTAAALELPRKSANRVREFISWDEFDTNRTAIAPQ